MSLDFSIIQNKLPSVVPKLDNLVSADEAISAAQEMLSAVDIQTSYSIQNVSTILQTISSADYFTDLTFDGSVTNFDEAFYNNRKEITEEMFNTLVSCLDAVVDQYGCITFIDAEGYPYIIQKATNDNLLKYFNFYRRSTPSGERNFFLYRVPEVDENDNTVWRYYINNTLLSVEAPYYTCLANLLIDLKESLALNEAIHDVCHLVTTNTTNFVNSALNVVSTLLTSSYDSVKQFAKGVRDSLGTGFTGVAGYISNYFKALSTATQNEGIISLTDNSKLVPQVYIAGAIIQIVGTVLEIVGMVIAIAYPIIGIGLAAIGGAINAFVQAMPSLEDSYAKLNSSTQEFIVNSAPYGCFQYTIIPKNKLPLPIAHLIDSGVEMGIVDVPFGKLYYGPCTRGSDNSATYLLEFHPSFHSYNYYPSASWFEDILGAPLFVDEGSGKAHLMYKADNDNVNLFYNAANALVEMARYADPIEVDDNGYYKTNDKLLRQNVESNCGAFWLWFSILIDLHHNLTDHYYYLSIPIYYLGYRIDGAYSQGIDERQMSGYFYAKFRQTYCKNPNTGFFGVNCIIPGGTSQLYDFTDGTKAQLSWTDIPDMCSESKFMTSFSGWPDNTALDPNIAPLYASFVVGSYREFPAADITYAILTPKYDLSRSIAFLIIASIVTIAITVCVIKVSLKIKKWRRRSRANNAANVNQAYEAYAKNPNSDEAYNTYVKAVRKNNWLSYLNGGTKYSKTDYWFGMSSSQTSSLFKPSNGLAEFGNDNITPVDTVITLIRGS